jgi:hypothetical protein
MADVLNLLPSEATDDGAVTISQEGDVHTLTFFTGDAGPLKIACVFKEVARMNAVLTLHVGTLKVLKQMLELRAARLVGCTAGSPEEAELAAIADLLDVYKKG